jgi:hypothetical protein
MKLYLLVDHGLSAGMKAAQAIHAFHAFSQEHPGIIQEWQADNNIVVLSHPELSNLCHTLTAKGIRYTPFYEPDLGDAMTAICIEPAGKRYVRECALA